MKRMLLLGLLSLLGSALPFLGGCESDEHPHAAYGYGYGYYDHPYYDDRPGHDWRYREHGDRDWDRDHHDWDHRHAGERW